MLLLLLLLLLLLIYKSPRCFLLNSKSTDLSVQEKKRQIDFQDGGHCGNRGFPIGTILYIYNLQVIPMLPVKFQVNWPFGSGEEAKIFKMATIAAILDFRSERLAILIYQSPEYVLTSFEANDLSVLRRTEKIFSRWRPWRPSSILDWNNLAIFDLHVTPMLPTEIQVGWPCDSGEDSKIDL